MSAFFSFVSGFSSLLFLFFFFGVLPPPHTKESRGLSQVIVEAGGQQ